MIVKNAMNEIAECDALIKKLDNEELVLLAEDYLMLIEICKNYKAMLRGLEVKVNFMD